MHVYLLQHRGSNAYAANGLGVVLFERGQMQEARSVFSSIREALPDMNPASLNLAHTLVCSYVHSLRSLPPLGRLLGTRNDVAECSIMVSFYQSVMFL